MCTRYNNTGHTVPAGSAFAPTMRDDTIANAHTTIKLIATGVLQNSSQIIKEEESCFFPPLDSSPILLYFVHASVEHSLEPAAWERRK